MGFDKLFADLAGKAVLLRSIEAFQNCPGIDEIVVVTSREAIEKVEAWKAGIPKLTRIVAGGAERHLSVYGGLATVDPGANLIAVHDGARPLVSPALIARCLEAATAQGAASAARPLTETIKRATPQGTAGESIDRTGLWAMETPQVASAALLRSAYEKIITEGLLVTDEVSALQHLGESVHLVENSEPNIKITFPGDLAIARAMIEARHAR